MTTTRRSSQLGHLLVALLLACAVFVPVSAAQSAAHPDAKPPLPDNPYLSYRLPWRWDVRAQLFLTAGNAIGARIDGRGRRVYDRVVSTSWDPRHIELIYPVVREGSFYWSPNKSVDAEIRLDNVDCHDFFQRDQNPVHLRQPEIDRKYIQGTYSEYSYWNSGDITGSFRQLHLIHTNHIVTAETVFNDDLARRLPWPKKWEPEPSAYLTPVVDSTGEPVPDDAQETVKTLLDFWIENKDPKSINELDLVKFLTGKVIEYVPVRGQSTELPVRSTSGGQAAVAMSSNSYGGFIVRPANEVAREPQGSKHDLATLLTAVLRSAGVPARTVICIDERIDDPLRNIVSLVEFAMHDPERDITFWVPIDVDRVRLNGARSSQFKRKWLYFGSHDRLSHYIPVAYYFHPPAGYKAYDLPDLYGIKRTDSTGERLPDYLIQSLLIDPIVSPTTANPKNPGAGNRDGR